MKSHATVLNSAKRPLILKYIRERDSPDFSANFLLPLIPSRLISTHRVVPTRRILISIRIHFPIISRSEF